METWQKVAAAVGVLALMGGAGKHLEQSDPNHVYGPAELGEDVGNGVDRVAGGVGDAAGGAIGKSPIVKGAVIGGAAYGGAKAWKKYGGGRNRDDPAPAPEDTTEPTLPAPAMAPMWGVDGG